MKKITKVLFLAGVLSLFAVAISNAQQVIISARLHGPLREVRPVRPSYRHVWVGGEYVPSGRTYIYRPGYWVMPPHPRTVWVPGHWRRYHRGYVWAGGFWR